MATNDNKKIWPATLLFPLWGLLRLWRSTKARGTKWLGTLGIAAYGIAYLVAVYFILAATFGLAIEWRGGFPPVLTFSKTVPDYVAVERHRNHQTNPAPGALASNLVVSPADWPEFRGAKRDGHYTGGPIYIGWPTNGLKQLWRQPIGGGYASFAMVGGVAFTIEQRRNQEAVTAYDLANGRELWAHLYDARFEEWMGGEGPRATPTFHEGRLYALGAQGHLKCLEARTGRVVWERNILQDNGATNLMYGMAASPLIVDEKVIVLPGGHTNNSVVAYHKETGAPVWKTLSDTAAYAAPMLVELAGRRQILVVLAKRVVGLTPERGELLWEFPWRVQYENSIAQPLLLSTNTFMLSGGYGAGCVAVEIVRTDNTLAPRQLWRNKNLKNKFTSSVLSEGHIYGLDEDMLTCLDALTGERKWKEGRYGYGQVLLASGHLVILGGEGQLALVRASPQKYHEVSRFPALRGKTWNHPAMAAGRLLVRNAVEMACFEVGPR